MSERSTNTAGSRRGGVCARCGMHVVSIFHTSEQCEIRVLRAEVERLKGALRVFAACDLNETNCADLGVATRRIRNWARAALEE